MTIMTCDTGIIVAIFISGGLISLAITIGTAIIADAIKQQGRKIE